VDVLLPVILIAVAFLLLVVLPGRARNRQVQSVQRMQAALEIGTEVMTSSGLYGQVVRLGAEDVDLEIAPGVVTTWALLAIREVKSPSREEAAPDDLDAELEQLESDADDDGPDGGPGRPSAGAD
jgi:preprotein translocase subunit YajC